MQIAILSLVALFIAIILGIIKPKLNVGFIAITFSLILGIFFAGMTDKEIVSLFPSNLFLMLIGVTTFFGIAEHIGLLDQIAIRSLKAIRGNTQLLPILFFLFSFFLSAIGPGNIAATAVLAPLGMSLAYKLKVNQFLMAIMIVTGANSGAFSPIAPTGVILQELAGKIEVGDKYTIVRVFIMSALIQSVSAFFAYILLGPLKKDADPSQQSKIDLTVSSFTTFQAITLITIILVILSVVVFDLSLAIATFSGAMILFLFKSDLSEEVIKKIPWDTILLVTGVSILIGVMDKAGGLELATTLLANYSPPGAINASLAFVTGLVSAYSSSSGVVMPAFIPLIPGIIEKMGGGGDAVRMLIAIAVGSHMVDVSPLSTLGALCIANAKEERQKLFRNLMFWGLSMALFGTLLTYLLLDLY